MQFLLRIDRDSIKCPLLNILLHNKRLREAMFVTILVSFQIGFMGILSQKLGIIWGHQYLLFIGVKDLFFNIQIGLIMVLYFLLQIW